MLSSSEKRSFIYLLTGSFLYGILMSSFKVQDLIAKKAFNAADWQITVIVMIWPLSNLISIWWGKLLEHSNTISRYLLITGIFGRLILILMLWVTSYYQYLGLMILMFTFNAIYSPASNIILQNNFTNENRAKVFGYLASLVTIASLLANLFAGKLLNQNENLFRIYFSIIGIVGFVQAILMMKIKLNKSHISDKAFNSVKEFIIKPVHRMTEIFKSNREFTIFQRNFFIYDFAFMMLMPTLPKFLFEVLKMDYSQSFLAKGVIGQIGIFLLAPLAGKYFHKKNPAYFTSFFFAVMSLFPIMLLVTVLLLSDLHAGTKLPIILTYISFFIYSIAMSGIVISWSVSSIYFAGSEDVSMYQSIHVTLTGIRAVAGSFMGLFIMRTLGISAVFICTIFLFMIASGLSYRQHLKIKE